MSDLAKAVIDAAREFRDKGTVLTACNRGPCQRVIECRDNSDPQAKLFAALKAYELALKPDDSNSVAEPAHHGNSFNKEPATVGAIRESKGHVTYDRCSRARLRPHPFKPDDR